MKPPTEEVIAAVPAATWRRWAVTYDSPPCWWFEELVAFLKKRDPAAAVKVTMLGPRGSYPEWDGEQRFVHILRRDW